MFCDNKLVVKNKSVPESVLKKIHNALCYHRVKEDYKEGTILVGWTPGYFNMSDLPTNTIMGGNISNGIVENIFNNKATALKK